MKINIKGPIVSAGEHMIYSWFGIPATTAQMVEEKLQQATAQGITNVVVEINSGGGSVFEASEIYTALRNFNGHVTVQIVGIAASAASVIAMAGTVIEMTPTGQVMIHNASNRAEGDYQVMDENSSFLQNTNKSIMNAYIQKTNKTEAELKKMMDSTTWMTAKQALENGFIDKIMFAENAEALASADGSDLLENGVLPKSVIEKVRGELLKNNSFMDVQNNVDSKDKVQNKEEVEKMDYETLKNSHPELFNQIYNEGKTDGVKNERDRIKAIEEFATPGNKQLIQNAKFESDKTVAEVAVDILRNQQKINDNYIKNAKEDAEEVEEIEPSKAPEEEKNKEDKEEEEVVDALTNYFKGGVK